tara:strand:- start:1578 stop:2195 length:618 start_codon:yes stop_codon:yes gene_type:complete
MNINIELKRIYNAYNNALEMLSYRGYETDKLINSSIELFNKRLDTEIFDKITGNNEQQCFLIIMKNQKITKKDFLSRLDTINKDNEGDDFLLLVLTFDKHLNSFIKLIQKKYSKDIQIFLIDELQMNILKHELQPDFILLSDDEKLDLINKYDVTMDQLPKIKLTDPVTKYYNAKVGDIFKIIRKSMVGRNRTSGQGIYYRIVIE